MMDKAKVRAEAMRLREWFVTAGALPVETEILQPADTLLDLYGEDIRARAFVTADPLAGEAMLRPDFTVPVARMHMERGVESARYAYAGEVFRRQEEDSGRPVEYLQAGMEVFQRETPAEADAEVFALISQALDGCAVTAETGDMGLIRDAVAGLNTTAPRKAALMRHVWRPRRFRELLVRFGGDDRGRAPPPKGDIRRLVAEAGPEIGLRSAEEVVRRIESLRGEADAEPLAVDKVDALDRLMNVAGAAVEALDTLRAMVAELPSIERAVDRMAARLAALEARGVDTGALPFAACHGRTTMEYYDGFTFAFAADREGWPPVATGGRYDALTRQLGKGRDIPAVGGVIRPALTLELRS